MGGCAIDWNLRNFRSYLTPRGSTYSAYLIVGEKIVLLDTVKCHFYPEMLETIKNMIAPERIDYLVCN